MNELEGELKKYNFLYDRLNKRPLPKTHRGFMNRSIKLGHYSFKISQTNLLISLRDIKVIKEMPNTFDGLYNLLK